MCIILHSVKYVCQEVCETPAGPSESVGMPFWAPLAMSEAVGGATRVDAFTARGWVEPGAWVNHGGPDVGSCP